MRSASSGAPAPTSEREVAYENVVGAHKERTNNVRAFGNCAQVRPAGCPGFLERSLRRDFIEDRASAMLPVPGAGLLQPALLVGACQSYAENGIEKASWHPAAPNCGGASHWEPGQIRPSASVWWVAGKPILT